MELQMVNWKLPRLVPSSRTDSRRELHLVLLMVPLRWKERLRVYSMWWGVQSRMGPQMAFPSL